MISFTPRSLRELRRMLAEAPDDTSIIAGGTDLIIQMNQNQVSPEALLYIGHVPELHEITVTETSVFIGSAVTMTEIAEIGPVPPCVEALVEAAGEVGSPQIRNRATIGGNIANAAPAGDLFGVLCLLGAKALIYQADGSITDYPIFDIVEAPGKTILKPSQILYGFTIPIRDCQAHYKKLGSRKKVTITRMNLQAAMRLDKGMTIRGCEIWVSAISPKPVCFSETAQKLVGRSINEYGLASIISKDISAYILKQKRASGSYKSKAIQGVAEDVITMFRSTS